VESRHRRRRSTSTGAIEQQFGHNPSSRSWERARLSARAKRGPRLTHAGYPLRREQRRNPIRRDCPVASQRHCTPRARARCAVASEWFGSVDQVSRPNPEYAVANANAVLEHRRELFKIEDGRIAAVETQASAVIAATIAVLAFFSLRTTTSLGCGQRLSSSAQSRSLGPSLLEPTARWARARRVGNVGKRLSTPTIKSTSLTPGKPILSAFGSRAVKHGGRATGRRPIGSRSSVNGCEARPPPLRSCSFSQSLSPPRSVHLKGLARAAAGVASLR
jgi:hypothetical protein